MSVDESTVPPRMVEMVRTNESFRRSGLAAVRSPYHSRKLMFALRPQAACCSECGNSLVVQTISGYIQPLQVGYCDKCQLQWQVFYLEELR